MVDVNRLKSSSWDDPIWDMLDRTCEEVWEDEEFVARMEAENPGLDLESDEAEEIVAEEGWKRLIEELEWREEMRYGDGYYVPGPVY